MSDDTAGAAGAAMNGTTRAAILLLALGETEAAEVLKHVDTDDVQKLGLQMAELSQVRRDQVANVLGQFVDAVEEETSLAIGTDQYMRNVLINAFGDEKGTALLDRILGDRGQPGLESLRWMEPGAIAEAIKHEHPQIIAIVLAYLEPESAGQVLEILPPAVASDVVIRIARLDDVQQSALRELEAIVVQQAKRVGGGKSQRVGGEKVAAGILNAIGSEGEEALLEMIGEADGELAARIQDQMLVFEALMDVTDRGIQTLLREISSDSLALALKGTDAAMQEKIYRNMSRRAAQMLAEDLEARGPVRVSDVEAAQKEILGVARRLAESGDIVMGGGDDYV